MNIGSKTSFLFLREGGTIPKDVYNLNLYERNVQVVGLRSTDAPILIDTIRQGALNDIIYWLLFTLFVLQFYLKE